MGSRAIAVSDVHGDPQNVWKIVTKDKPKPSAGNVVVHFTLRPVNPGVSLAPKLFLSHLNGNDIVIGSEGVGYVDQVGDGVTKVKKGQRVVPAIFKQFYAEGNGSWQDYAEVPQEDLFILPDSIPDEVAAQFIGNPWAAYGLLKDQDVPKGDYLLQNAAASVLGRVVIQIAKHWGFKTINIVRRDDIKDELKKLGADEVINSTTEDVVARVKEITGGKGAFGAIDSVAGTQTKAMVSSVKDGGKVFVYGVLGSPEFEATVGVFDLGRVELKFWSLQTFLNGGQRQQETADAVTKLLEDKVIVPFTGKTFQFEDFKAALLEAEKPSRGGKVLIAT